MDLWIICGIVLFFGCILGSRQLTLQAARRLDDAQKEALVGGFNTLRWVQLLPLVALLVLFFLLQRAGRFDSLRLGLFGGVLAATFVGVNAYAVSYLRKIGLPREYTRTYVLARALVALGLLLWVVALWQSGQARRSAPPPAVQVTLDAPGR